MPPAISDSVQATRTEGWRAESLQRNLRKRKIRLHLDDQSRVVEYRLGVIKQWLTVDDRTTEIDQKLGTSLEFMILDGSRELNARIEIDLMADNFAIKRIRLLVMGRKEY